MKILNYEKKPIKRGTYGSHLASAKAISTARSIILYSIIMILSIIYISISIMLNNPDKSLFGYKMEIVKTGSMEPTIPVHSLVMINNQENYEMNDVINFIYEDQSYTHRIVSIGDNVYKTKGDANNVADTEIVDRASIVGKVMYHSSWIGSAIVSIRNISIKWFVVGIVSILGLVVIVTSVLNRNYSDLTFEEKIRANKKAIRSYRFYQKKFIWCLKFGIKVPKKGNYDITN